MIGEVSVIVPLYNSQKYIQRLFNNFREQTYRSFIVYFIDDGSTDDTAMIASELVKTDCRFRLLQKRNGGPSSARNFGLKSALSDGTPYLMFVDSDDYFDRDYFEKMIGLISEYDVDIVFASHFFNDKPKKEYLPCDTVMDSFSSLCLILGDQVITSQSHHKIFKKEVWQDVLFPENTYFLEDTATIYKTILKSQRCLISNYRGYHYNVSNSESITKQTICNKYIICGWRSLYSIITNDFSVYDSEQIRIINKKAKSLFIDNFLELFPRIKNPDKAEKKEVRFYYSYAKRKNYILAYECKNRRQIIKKVVFFAIPCLYRPLFKLFLFLKKP